MKRLMICRDDDAQSPREWDNLGKMVCWHRRATLGDVQFSKISSGMDPEQYIDGLPKGTIVLPLYLYEHSGMTMKTGPFSDSWDSGQVGFIYATPDTICKEMSVKGISKELRAKVQRRLESEVETYDAYLTGNVWDYQFEVDGELVDSCHGFYIDHSSKTPWDMFSVPDEAQPFLKEAWKNRGDWVTVEADPEPRTFFELRKERQWTDVQLGMLAEAFIKAEGLWPAYELHLTKLVAAKDDK